MTLPLYLARTHDNTVRLHVWIQPRASRTRLLGIYNEKALKIAVCAPPVDGEANAAVRDFLARTFKIAKSSVVLCDGTTSRQKTFELTVDPDQAHATLLQALESVKA